MALSVRDAAQYAYDVSAGDVVSCKWVKLACKRFIDDLESGQDRGLDFDADDAQYALDFYDLTTHVKGDLSGQPIELEPWQGFIIINLFGWKWQSNGKRRFNTSYSEVARKNAKSTLSSGIGLFMAGFDGEGGAEVYSAATTRDQARIVFNDARAMALKSPVLRSRFGVFRNNIHVESNASKFEPLSADANTLDGLNVHCAIIDELHAHKTREVYDVMETATGARSQPLLFNITTAGFNRQGICYEVREYATKVLEGTVDDDSFFAVVYTLDEGDDWKDESTWIKANPNIGVSVSWADIRRLAKKAIEMPTARNNFLTKRLNVWVNAETAWLNMEKWHKCPAPADDEYLKTLPCYIGLDLANKLDVAAMIGVFVDGKKYHIRCKFWLPENQIYHKPGAIGNLYDTWAKQGILTLTDGDTIDHDYIEDDIRAWLDKYDVQEVAFDPWGGTQLANHLAADGAPMIEVPQTVKNLSEAMKEVEALVVDGALLHGGNPMLDWMASNVTAKIDKNENIFPNKEHADNKIDGMVAMFTAMSRILTGANSSPEPTIHIL